MSQIIVMLGKPGSGKDTQALRLAKRMNYKLIKTGDYARGLSKTNTKVAQLLKNGGLIDNKLINEYVADEIKQNSNTPGFITDGYPRDVTQAIWFDDFLTTLNQSVDKVILLKLDDDIAKQRLIMRGRSDDKKTVIARRLEVYHQVTSKVIDYYQSKNKLAVVDASLSPDDVSRQIERLFL